MIWTLTRGKQYLGGNICESGPEQGPAPPHAGEEDTRDDVSAAAERGLRVVRVEGFEASIKETHLTIF
jgi:hypothetical protein